MKKEDKINHPKHYVIGKMEVIEIIENFDLGYHLGNVIKYILRARHKENYIQDLKKAQFYLNRFISNEEKRLKVK